MNQPQSNIAVLWLVLAWLGSNPVCADHAKPLIFADHGRTNYRIIIGKNADYGETKAAEEMSHFLWRMTGAEFGVVRDSAVPSDFEIVLGETNRKRMAEVPDDLKTDNWEGFSILREGEKLYIMGNIPRGTLYGVYDFLDVELGVRFLTGEVTHVPQKRTLTVDVKSRTYGPAFEQRTIWEGLGGSTMIVRSRMNGIAFIVANSRLGGVKLIGEKVHTFNALVPAKEHFDEHPEYFSLIEGERRSTYDGMPTQICMSNPDVAGVALKTIRGWLGPQVKANPYNKYLVNVTVNDSPNFCECDPCMVINREEDCLRAGGTMVRFVNTVATRLAEEYPNVGVEAMHYGTSIPKKTKFVSNVLTKIVVDPDYRVPLDDSSNEENRKTLERIQEAKEAVGDGSLYVWTRMFPFGANSYVNPHPNLTAIIDCFRVMAENGVRGLFIQASQGRGTEMQDLRYYLLARALWRPELDNREQMEEFCRLYYGQGAEGVLRYIDFLHEQYGPTNWWNAPYSDTTAPFDEKYLVEGDAILAEAESMAESDEIRRRVATCRLPIWKIKLDRAFGEVGKVLTMPVEWSFKIDPDDIGLKEAWQETRSFGQWNSMQTDTMWTLQGEERRGVGWYGIEFDMPDIGGGATALWFGAVSGKVDVFLDGEKVGEQQLHTSSMWCQGFYIPLGKSLTPGKHTLIVRVFMPNFNAGLWKPVSIIDMSAAISDDLRTAGRRFVDVGRAADLSFLTESYGGRFTQTEKAYYPTVEFFLTHGVP